MGLRCWLRHSWDGCKCARCGKVRLYGHRWSGCKCEICSLARDQDHEWELRACREICRWCGREGDTLHDWAGCRCRRCGATHHAWVAGRCSICGLICEHPAAIEQLDSIDDETFRGSLNLVCKECGQRLGEIWRK